MNNTGLEPLNLRQAAYGENRFTFVDRFGIYLSTRRICKSISHLQKPFSMLDIGCGYQAGLLQYLYDDLSFGIGIDIKISDNLKKKEKLTFIKSPMEDALDNLQSQKFDLITLISVLEHLWNPEKVLAKVKTILQPDGLLLINVPTWRGKYFLEFSAYKLGLSPRLEMDDHKMYYDQKDLWPLLVRAGFKPGWIKMAYYKFGLNLFVHIRAQENQG